MAILETALISALAPAVVEAFKSIAGGLGRKFGGLSVDDQIKLQVADMERLKALAVLDTPGGIPSQWVVDLRGAFRYVGAALAISSGIYLLTVPGMAEIGAQLIAIPFSFIFGERMILSLRK
jgi:hypothetical protein